MLLLPIILILTRLVTTSSSGSNLKYRSPAITSDGKVIGNVEVWDDQEPADQIFDFVQLHNLGEHIQQGILEHACEATKCERQTAILYKHQVNGVDGQLLGSLVIMEGQAPGKIVNSFSKKIKLPYSSSRQLLDIACSSQRVTCDSQRDRLEIYSMLVPVDGVDRGTVTILEGEEPADIIHQFCKEKDLSKEISKQIVANACSLDHVPCTRDYAVLYESGDIWFDGVNVGSLEITEYSGEPIDVIHEFCQQKNLPKDVRRQLLVKACQSTTCTCTREIPVVYRNSVQVDEVDLGEFVVLEGQEPVDAVFNFYKLRHRLGRSVRMGLLNDICSRPEIPCTRTFAVLYDSGPINLDGNLLQSFVVHEDEEPADVAYAYARRTSAGVSRPTVLARHVEAQLVEKACATIDINCTRVRALLVERKVRVPGNCTAKEDMVVMEDKGKEVEGVEVVVVMEEEGEEPWDEPCPPCVPEHDESVQILDGEEAVDQVERFCRQHDLPQQKWRNAILKEVCNDPAIVCTRDRPLLFETDIAHGPRNELSSRLTILENDIPSQILYSFASEHGMSVETIDFLLEKICAPPLGTGTLETCSNSSSRYKNVVLEQPINIDNRIMSSPLLLRDDKREPADVIDEYCLRHNITRDMRNNIITKVCGSGQVVCGREKPVIYRWPFINFTTGEVYGEVEILGGQSVVDVVHLYLLQLDHPMINQTFMEPHVVNAACDSIRRRGDESYGISCDRRIALYYEKPVRLDDPSTKTSIVPDVPMRIYGNGIEPVDQIYEYCRRWKLNRDIQTALLNDACRPSLYPGINCQRADALVYERSVQVWQVVNCSMKWDTTTNETKVVRVLDSEETYDAENDEEKKLWLLNNITEKRLKVTRSVELFQGQQVADVLERFRFKYNDTINRTERDVMIREACRDTRVSGSWDSQCTRLVPVLFEQSLSMPASHGGGYVGVLQIMEPVLQGEYDGEGDGEGDGELQRQTKGAEIADQVLEFALRTGLPPSMRRNMVSVMCGSTEQLRYQHDNTSMCKRWTGLLLNSTIEIENQKYGPITLWGNKEPCDQIDQWTHKHGYSYEIRDALIQGICEVPRVRGDCTRRIVSHWSVLVGTQLVEFLEGQDATDLLYKAFRSTGQMQWQRYRVLDIACSQPRMICTRKSQALLGVVNIPLNDTYGVEKLYLWEGGSFKNEIIDMVHSFTKKHGMGYQERLSLVMQLCQRFGPPCTRTVPVVAWIPVNRDNNVTCPKSIFDRPFDKNDLLLLFFEHYNDWTKEKRKNIDEMLKSKDGMLSGTRIILEYVRDNVLFELNRTKIFAGTIHANESFPVLWLVVNFDRHIALPYMLALGWLPLFLITAACGLQFLEQSEMGEEAEAMEEEVVVVEEEEEEERKAKKQKSKKKRKRGRKLVEKVKEEQHRGGRYRAKTPVRVTEKINVEEEEGDGEENDDDDEEQQHGQRCTTASIIHILRRCSCRRCCRRCCRCCCCFPCDATSYISRRWMCGVWCPQYVVAYDKSIVRPSWLSIFVCLMFCYGHMYMVEQVYTDVLHGFFIKSPYTEAANYYDPDSGNFMGDIMVLENVAPIDALYEFASKFGTYGTMHLNTPILRRPRYWNLFQQLCEENPHLDCSRRTPREEMMDKISVNQNGYKLDVSYKRPIHPSDCKNVTLSNQETGGRGVFQTTSCVVESADNFCKLLSPSPPDCIGMIAEQIMQGLQTYQDTLRWDGKQQYRAVELTRDVSNYTIRTTVERLTYENAVPCRKGPHDFGMKGAWHRVGRFHKTLSMTDDPEERDFYDQPCRVIFGAMCARTKPSGDMLIEQMN